MSHLETKTPALACAAATLCLLVGCSDDPEPKPASAPAPHQLAVLADPGVEAPHALVDVPDGFEDGDDWYVVSTDGDTFLGLWTTESVERDACLPPTDDDVVPGSSVGDLASALVEQGSTDASQPAAVSLAGYEGLYLEVTGPPDLHSCAEGPGLANARGIYSDDQLDRLWLLDVDGQRVIVDAASGPTSSGAEIDALSAMVKSIELATDAR